MTLEGSDSDWRVSRRQFLAGMVALTSTLTLPLRSDAAVGIFQPFSFGYVSDVHLTTGVPDSYMLVHESQLFLQDIVKQLNGHNLSFVIFGGDQVHSVGPNDANWNLFQDVAQGLEMPWSFVLGERDITSEIPVDKMRTYGPDWKGHGIETDKPYWSQNPLPNIHLIGLDTSLPNTTAGDISNRQLDWLKQDLQAAKRKLIIVFSHHPLLPPPPYDGGSPWDEFTLQRAAAVREVLGSSPFVHLAVNGHVHTSKVQQERDIWYVSCPSLAVYPCAYRVFRVSPDNVTIETYEVGFPALVKKARKALISSDLAYKYDSAKPAAFLEIVEGDREDQNAILPFERGASPRAISPKKQNKPEKVKPEKVKPEKAEKKSKGKSKPEVPETKAQPQPEPQQKTPASTPESTPADSGPPAGDSGAPAAPPADE